jgi:hypothetical protein
MARVPCAVCQGLHGVQPASQPVCSLPAQLLSYTLSHSCPGAPLFIGVSILCSLSQPESDHAHAAAGPAADLVRQFKRLRDVADGKHAKEERDLLYDACDVWLTPLSV